MRSLALFLLLGLLCVAAVGARDALQQARQLPLNLVKVSVFEQGDNFCAGTYAPYPFSVLLAPGVCSENVPDPWAPSGSGGGSLSMNISLDAETNLYTIGLFNGANCTGDELVLAGQGSECVADSGLYTPYQVQSPLLAPCSLTSYVDQYCSGNVTNVFGVRENQCDSSSIAPYIELDLLSQPNSFNLNGFNGVNGCDPSQSAFSIYGGTFGSCSTIETYSVIVQCNSAGVKQGSAHQHEQPKTGSPSIRLREE